MPGINVQFASPNQACLLALLHNLLEKAAKDVYAIAFTDTGEARMIGQGLIQIIVG
jgi:hypothetical protein